MSAKVIWINDHRPLRTCKGCRWTVSIWKLPTCALGYKHSSQGGQRCRHYESNEAQAQEGASPACSGG